jgi:hypothetical protein
MIYGSLTWPRALSHQPGPAAHPVPAERPKLLVRPAAVDLLEDLLPALGDRDLEGCLEPVDGLDKGTPPMASRQSMQTVGRDGATVERQHVSRWQMHGVFYAKLAGSRAGHVGGSRGFLTPQEASL